MIRDGIVHVWHKPDPEECLFPDEVVCSRERPYLPARGVRTIFHVDYRVLDGGYLCAACGAASVFDPGGERRAEA
jgi:hypothetical protein